MTARKIFLLISIFSNVCILTTHSPALADQKTFDGFEHNERIQGYTAGLVVWCSSVKTQLTEKIQNWTRDKCVDARTAKIKYTIDTTCVFTPGHCLKDKIEDIDCYSGGFPKHKSLDALVSCETKQEREAKDACYGINSIYIAKDLPATTHIMFRRKRHVPESVGPTCVPPDRQYVGFQSQNGIQLSEMPQTCSVVFNTGTTSCTCTKDGCKSNAGTGAPIDRHTGDGI